MQLWIVYETHPVERNQRKKRVYRYVVLAETAEQAIEKIQKGEWSTPEVREYFRADEFTYTAEPWGSEYATLSCYLE